MSVVPLTYLPALSPGNGLVSRIGAIRDWPTANGGISSRRAAGREILWDVCRHFIRVVSYIAGVGVIF